jgi:hypothetical protein
MPDKKNWEENIWIREPRSWLSLPEEFAKLKICSFGFSVLLKFEFSDGRAKTHYHIGISWGGLKVISLKWNLWNFGGMSVGELVVRESGAELEKLWFDIG